MRFLRGLLDRIVLVAAVIAGGLVPGFIAQYRQRLGGRLDQAELDLEPWQRIADQFHQGDLGRLVQYHLSSSDPTFHSEGEVIRSLIVTVRQLQSAVEAMQGSLAQQVRYLAFHLDAGLARATWQDWIPTFALSVEGIAFALVCSIAVWLAFHAVWWVFVFAARSLRRRPRTGAGTELRAAR